MPASLPAALGQEPPTATPATSGPEAAAPAGKAPNQSDAGADARADAKGESAHWRFYWKDGLQYEILQNMRLLRRSLPDDPSEADAGIESRDEQPSGLRFDQFQVIGKIGARLQLDAAAYAHAGGLQPISSDAEVRRFRVYTTGELIWGLPVYYKVEVGLISQRFQLFENYVWFRNVPYVGNVWFGRVRPPMTLEASGSSRDLTFLEKAGPVQALAPDIQNGIQVGRPAFDRRLTWTLGLFGSSGFQDAGDASEASRIIGRLTWLPVMDPEGSRLVHLGLSGSYSLSSSDTIRFRSTPESHQAPFLVDTGEIHAANAFTGGLEAAMVNGPFSLQGEALSSHVNEAGDQKLHFGGVYMHGSWFLTGESRPYDQSRGSFSRVAPRTNFSIRDGGLGAWEGGLRYSYLDLNSGNINGGRMHMAMAGLNWYWNPNFKMKLNAGFGYTADGPPTSNGDLYLFQMRAELNY